MNFRAILSILIINLSLSLSANILAVYQNPTPSHSFYHSVFLKQLAKRGHNITVFTPHIMNLQEFPNVLQHHFKESFEIHKKVRDPIMYKQKKLKIHEIAFKYEQPAFYNITRSQLAHPEMQKLLKESQNYKFDVLIVECYLCHFVLLAEIFNCPIIISHACEADFITHGMMGNDNNPALYPETWSLPYLHRHLTFSERFWSLLFVIFQLSAEIFAMKGNYGSKIQSEFFPTKPVDVGGIFHRRTSLLFTNTNQAFGHIRPLMPNTIQIGFSHVEPPKTIENPKIQKFLDESTNGVIVMGFGSRAETQSLDERISRKFLNVFGRIGFNVIWKSSKIGLKSPKNVLLIQDLPFADVLAHSNVKLFIAHGGLLTAYEAIDREVPMIIFPLIMDHAANARMLVNNKVAVEMDLNTFSEEELKSAIKEVLNEKFKENLRKLKYQVYNQPMSSRDLAVWHVENVIKNGNYQKVKLSTFNEQIQRYYLDLILFFLIFVALLWFCVKKIVSLVFKIKIKPKIL